MTIFNIILGPRSFMDASLLSNVFLGHSFYFDDHEIIKFQKLVENPNKMTVANLSRDL